MSSNSTLLRRSFSVIAIAASWGIACTAGDPSTTTTSSGTSDTKGGTTIDTIDPTTHSTTIGDLGTTTGIDKIPPSANCGDGILDEEEACDDGTPGGGDGCGANCLFVEPGFLCREAGTPCRPYSVCGDGVAIFPEQCDSGGVPVPGCTDQCKLELGYKCDGSPSTCMPTTCGDAKIEGTETCEDGNTIPFDGCDANCNKEPDCKTTSGMGCTSSCGDGLIIGDEECDDGNGVSGDGCSADCKSEDGYTCSVPPAVDPDLPLTLPIVFRDFSTKHSDFQDADPLGADDRPCDGYSPGIPTASLNADGKPVFASSPAKSCVASAASFGQWYTENSENDSILSSIKLYPNGKGGYVNRFGANGEKYLAVVPSASERQAGTSEATCATACKGFARDSQPPFMGLPTLRCDDKCRSFADDAMQMTSDQLNNANIVLAQLQTPPNGDDPDPEAVAAQEDKIVLIEAAIADLNDQGDQCKSDCEDELAKRTATCTLQCAPCSSGTGYCIGGEVLELDGNPLFLPIDEGTMTRSPNSERSAARIPAQVYQGLGWPWEDRVNCKDGDTLCKSMLHNFAFTSEIAYWFQYNADTVADLTFLGDDDVFVFINRHLVLDIGGIHVPLGGQFSLAAGGAVNTRVWEELDPGDDAPVPMKDIVGKTTAAALGMTPGNVYEIKVFHAERKPEGSSFQLTLAGFNAARSTCVPTCGDGIVAGGEQCDNGEENSQPGETSHNGCNSDCSLGSFCGDGVVQEEEECDDKAPGVSADCSNCRLIRVK